MKASWKNILDETASTVTVTSFATGYDDYRLYDRLMGRQWKASSTSTQTVHIDQGASPLPVNSLIIPSGHLLSGCTLAWQYSDNNSTWSDMVTSWYQSGSGEIKQSTTSSITHRYWRLTISGASVAPQAAEVWMGVLRTFIAGFQDGSTYRLEDVTVTQQSLYAKTPHFLSLGDAKYYLSGDVIVGTDERTYFDEWFLTWAGYKPFYFEDHKGNAYFAYFVSKPEYTEGLGYSKAKLEIQQVW